MSTLPRLPRSATSCWPRGADDVRSLGRRAARCLASDAPVEAPPGDGLILIAPDLGPADVAEMARALAGIALAGGAPTAHAAIVARSLGIPMVTGLSLGALERAGDAPLVLDGDSGRLVVDPSSARTAAAQVAMRARRQAEALAHADWGRLRR